MQQTKLPCLCVLDNEIESCLSQERGRAVLQTCALQKAIGEVFQDILPPDRKGTVLILQVRIVCMCTVL